MKKIDQEVSTSNGKNYSLQNKGFSLLELCSAIALVTLSSTIALPHFKQFLMRQERNAIIEKLILAIEFAKQEAFLRNKIVSLCATRDQIKCEINHWEEGFMVFEGNEKDPRKPNKILQTFEGTRYGKIDFEQFGQYLNIHPDGMTQNVGTFIYCPKNRDHRETAALVINRASRVYRVIARNQSGSLIKNAETPEASPILCR